VVVLDRDLTLVAANRAHHCPSRFLSLMMDSAKSSRCKVLSRCDSTFKAIRLPYTGLSRLSGVKCSTAISSDWMGICSLQMKKAADYVSAHITYRSVRNSYYGSNSCTRRARAKNARLIVRHSCPSGGGCTHVAPIGAKIAEQVSIPRESPPFQFHLPA
jgi:hypothetical protein